jgi:hypothetical protein
VFWENRNKTRTTKKKKESKTWIYKVLTEYDVYMSEMLVYLPLSLGFWPKWRSIPRGPRSGTSKI